MESNTKTANGVIRADVSSAIALLQDIKGKTTDAIQHVNKLLQNSHQGDFSTELGLSFLEVKYQLLLSYLMNQTYMMLRKVGGHSVQGETTIDRLVEIRTVLEKIRPIDQKLKYQVDKCIKRASNKSGGIGDPLRFKANPDNLVSKVSDEESGSDEDDDNKDRGKAGKVYVPPKLAAMHYDGDDTVMEKREKLLEKGRKRALSSHVLSELREEYDEGPQEIRESRDLHRLKADKRTKDRTKYEEDNFMRFSISKKEKASMSRMATTSTLAGLTHFEDISVLDKDGGDMCLDSTPNKKRKTSTGKKGKGKKKGFKGRRKH